MVTIFGFVALDSEVKMGGSKVNQYTRFLFGRDAQFLADLLVQLDSESLITKQFFLIAGINGSRAACKTLCQDAEMNRPNEFKKQRFGVAPSSAADGDSHREGKNGIRPISRGPLDPEKEEGIEEIASYSREKVTSQGEELAQTRTHMGTFMARADVITPDRGVFLLSGVRWAHHGFH